MSTRKLEQINEITKCSSDVQYFIEHYIKLNHTIDGTVPFILNEEQVKFLNQIKNNNYNLWYKNREVGATTLLTAYCLWQMLFLRNNKIIFFNPNTSMALICKEKFDFMLKNIPEWLLLTNVDVSTKKRIAFSNASNITFATKIEEVKGTCSSSIVIDERSLLPLETIELIKEEQLINKNLKLIMIC